MTAPAPGSAESGSSVTADLHVVIPAGGSGTRLWPLSRAARPKFLHALTGDRTLLQETVDRLADLAPPSRVHVVTGVTHAAAVARQLPEVPEGNVFVEPSPRDSCAAIALAAAVIGQRSPDAVMGAFPADHLISDTDRFRSVVRQAAAVAAAGHLTTIGITPTRPETGYGYLRTASALGDADGLRVAEFKEKPSYQVAEAYLTSGDYLWNAGMFLWRVSVFLDELSRQRPELHAGVMRVAGAWDSGARESALAEEWPALEKISVDYAVMEGAAAAGRVATVPGDFGWNDIGDFRALGDMLPADESGNVVVGAAGRTLLREVSGTVITPASGRLVAALGVRDLVIVDTDDAVLVCHRDRAQDVKKLVDALRDQGDTDHV